MKVIRTNDGTDTLYNDYLDEHYHSIHGARNESEHVFIDNGLEYITSSQNVIKVFEMGFGTGLNALLSLDWALKSKRAISYRTIETNPVSTELINKLNFSSLVNLEYLRDKFIEMHVCNWQIPSKIDSSFTILKQKISLSDIVPEKDTDVIFFDAFSPDKQPELWTVTVFTKMFHMLKENGVLVTYCAKGYVRRNMIEAGFKVERLAGPPGKREMLRAFLI